MASSSISEPTLVLYKSSMCRHCQNLTNIWDSVKVALTGVYPKLRFYELTAKDNSGKFDENIHPKDLSRYSRWFPMILLVPGKTWDAAMSNLGPRNPIEIKDGVQMMNAKWEGNDIKYDQKYNIQNPADFAKWLREGLNNPDFKRVQSAEPAPSSSSLPSAPSAIQPIAPLISNIARPASRSIISTNSSSVHAVGDGDVCRLRVISRPR